MKLWLGWQQYAIKIFSLLSFIAQDLCGIKYPILHLYPVRSYNNSNHPTHNAKHTHPTHARNCVSRIGTKGTDQKSLAIYFFI